MAYRLVVANTLDIPVRIALRDGAEDVTHRFHLTGVRIDQAEYRRVTADPDMLLREWLHKHITGWRGQRIVLDAETGQPADFSPAAFDCLLSVMGMEQSCLQAYLSAVMTSFTPAERAKN